MFQKLLKWGLLALNYMDSQETRRYTQVGKYVHELDLFHFTNNDVIHCFKNNGEFIVEKPYYHPMSDSWMLESECEHQLDHWGNYPSADLIEKTIYPSVKDCYNDVSLKDIEISPLRSITSITINDGTGNIVTFNKKSFKNAISLMKNPTIKIKVNKPLHISEGDLIALIMPRTYYNIRK
jgi:hypothetical protein